MTGQHFPADEQLDRFMAEKVFGLIPCQGIFHQAVPCYAHPHDPEHGTTLPNYSQDLSAAWAAAHAANLFSNDAVSLIRNKEGLWEVRAIDYQAGDWETLSTAPTIPLALCRAIHGILNAPAAPAENSRTRLIEPLNSQVFAGKSFIQTMLEKPTDAKKQGKNTTSAPAAPTQNPTSGPKLPSGRLWKDEIQSSAPAAPPENLIIDHHPINPTTGYPKDWPSCVSCGEPALTDHLTCGKVACREGEARGNQENRESTE